MKDPTNMTHEQKYAYIFYKRRSKIFPGGRFHWISCLLGDIRTFLDGAEHYLQYDTYLCDMGGGECLCSKYY